MWAWVTPIWEYPGMIFGDVRAAGGIVPAEWIGPSRRGRPGSVGALLPNQYPSMLRVWAPDPCAGDWWSLYRDLFAAVASIGERHTSNPDRAWFAIWEGHGFDTATTRIAHLGPLSDADRRELDRERERLREEDRRRNAAIGVALDSIPRFEVSHRAYYLLEGTVAAVTLLSYPGFDGWRNPDLFWPDDRRWFIATDVDFWSLYVGGEHDFIGELARHVSTRCEFVALDDQLEIED